MNRKIGDIFWKVTSPYGTYVAFDRVEIFVDDVTFDYEVQKNGGVITSGNQIPVKFTRTVSGVKRNQDYYKEETYFQFLICDGTTKIKHERKAGFPYFSKVEQADHPACSLTPEVCDLHFDSLPVITDATPTNAESLISSSLADGEITVSATSTYDIEYRLNDDFVYGDGSGQSSGTFSGLNAGTYKVFARDEHNCLNWITATVGLTTTYGVKYRIEYYDLNGLHHKTEILQRGFVGSVTEITGADEPTEYNLRGEGERYKFIPMVAGEIILSMISTYEGQFQTLYTSDPERFKIKHSIDEGSGYGAVWTGFLLPNQYKEDYVSVPYHVSVVASDGLPGLKDIPFLDDDGDRFVGTLTQIEILAFILKKLKLGLSIRCACNLYALTTELTETPMDSGATDDPLDQTFVDPICYYTNTEVPNCKEVLEKILEPYGAVIIQYGNYWNIIRWEERVNAFDFRIFNSIGVYVSNGTYNPIKDVKLATESNRIVWKDEDQELQINPGLGLVTIAYNLGLKDNIFENGDFSTRHNAHLFSSTILPGLNGFVYSTISPDLRGFELVANETVIESKYEIDKDGNVLLNLITDSDGGYLVTETINLKMGNSDQIKVSYVFGVKKPDQVDLFDNVELLKVRFMVTFDTYYLKEDGSWTTDETTIVHFIKEQDLDKLQKVEVLAYAPDSLVGYEGPLNIKMWLVHKNYFDVEGLVTFKAIPTVSLSEGYTILYSDTVKVEAYKLTNTTDSPSDTAGLIRPDDYNSSTNPYQWVLMEGTTSSFTTSKYTTIIDKIGIEFLSNGMTLPKQYIYTAPGEPGNKIPFSKEIFHGSYVSNGQWIMNEKYFNEQLTANIYGTLPQPIPGAFVQNYGGQPTAFSSANSAKVVYTSWLRNAAGEGWVNWSRDMRAEKKLLQQITADMIAAQYNKPCRSLIGSFVGDILFTPIDTIRETMDENRKYVPIKLNIKYRRGFYNSEMLEMISVADADIDLEDPGEDGAGFTTGFSIGFNA